MHNDPKVKILTRQVWGNYILLKLDAPLVAEQAEPGQFVMIKVNDYSYPLLRRPLCIHAVNGHTIEIFFQQTGLGTTILGEKRPGDTIDLIAPLGNGFDLPVLSIKEVALIGGGRGIAPLYFLAQKLQHRSIPFRIFYGGKSSADLPLREKLTAAGFTVACAAEDGTYGYKGLVTDLFEEELKQSPPANIYACGPDPMLIKVADIARENNIKAELSLESVMGCGFGACWGCVHKIKKDGREDWTKICQEGPVFPAEQIIWTENQK